METSSGLADIAVQMTKVEAEIEKVDSQITKIEEDIEKAEHQADEARINGNENERKRWEKQTDYLRDEKKQLRDEKNKLRDKENQLREQKTVLLKLIPNEGFIDQQGSPPQKKAAPDSNRSKEAKGQETAFIIGSGHASLMAGAAEDLMTSESVRTIATTNSQVKRLLEYFCDQYGDHKWQSYMRYSPQRIPELETFVNTVKSAQVEISQWNMTIDGELQNGDSGELWTAEHSRRVPQKILIDHIALAGELDKDNAWSTAKTIYVVRLPMEIPLVEENILRDTLFVREDDLAQFQMVRSLKKAVLTGNPGIGKSWYQWQVLLWSLRPDIYGMLLGRSQGSNELPPNHNHVNHPPSVILRYMAGLQLCHVFFLNENPPIVHKLKKFDEFYLLDREDSLLLFEPGKSLDPVPYELLVKIQILATVSPDKRRTKEFMKHSGIKSIMPCPSTAELLVMANYYRPFSLDEKQFTKETILGQIKQYGPFPRYVLATSARDRKQYEDARRAAVKGLSGEKLNRLVMFFSIEASSAGEEVSHWFLRYEVDRRSNDPYDVESAFLMISSEETFQMLCKKRDQVDLSAKISALQQCNSCEGKGMTDVSRIWLEDVFSSRALEGLTWHLLDTQWNEKERALQLVPARTIKIKVDKMETGSVPKELKENVLYARMGENFPFIDGLWMKDNCFFFFQATTAMSNPKTVETFEKAVERLNLKLPVGGAQKMEIFYVVMPFVFEEMRGKETLPLSFVWANCKKDAEPIRKLCQQLKIGLIAPDKHFNRKVVSSG